MTRSASPRAADDPDNGESGSTDTADTGRLPDLYEVAAGIHARDLRERSLALLTAPERSRYRLVVILQMFTALLDTLGVLLLGVVALTATAATTGSALPESVQRVLNTLGLQNLSLKQLTLVLGATAAVLLVVKPLIVLYVNRRVTQFLARCAADVSARLSRRFFDLPVVYVYRFSSQFSSVALSRSVNTAVIEVLTNSMTFRVELALMSALGVALLLVDPLTTVFAVTFFGLVVLALTRGLSGWARRSGEINAHTDLAAFASVQDGIATYREVYVANRRNYFIERFADLRRRGATAYADLQFIGVIPRYAMEVASVAGAFLLVVGLLTTQSIDQAIGSLALFFAAASRVTPSMLRLNSARLGLHGIRGQAGFAYIMADFLAEFDGGGPPHVRVPVPDQPFPTAPAVVLRDVSVSYPGAGEPALRDVSADVPPASRLALVGPSGAGKTTLADAILGVARPDSGTVLIDGVPPVEYIQGHPGAIAYVPQDVALISGTVRDNVAVGLPPEQIDDDRVWAALDKAHLGQFLREARDGLDTLVGERGVQLSGGQRQRLGIARALYTDPVLLVMDEATSALDAETEHLITGTLEGLGRKVTMVTVAHRLATIRRADQVLYLEDGVVKARGTFEDVRRQTPRFDQQARLLGL